MKGVIAIIYKKIISEMCIRNDDGGVLPVSSKAKVIMRSFWTRVCIVKE